MTGLERVLAERFPGRVPRATFRGGTALYLAFKAVEQIAGRGEIVVPATVCPDVPIAAALAGFTPRFCDVDLDTFCMTPETVSRVLGPRTRAAVVVHLFGKSADAEGMARILRPRNIALIEDLAQSVGGDSGRAGDWSVLSFDPKKLLPGRGGALLAREASLAEAARDAAESLGPPMPLAELNRVSDELNGRVRGWAERMRAEGIRRATNELAELASSLGPLYLARPGEGAPSADALDRALAGLEAERKSRHRRLSEFDRHLGPAVRRVRFAPSEMCWRLPVLLARPGRQPQVLADLRRQGALVSDHYFPVSWLWGDEECVQAREIGLRAINLCVDSALDERLVPGVAAVLRADAERP